jgi:hypothetical protein
VHAAWQRARPVQTDVNSNRPRMQQSSDADTRLQEEITLGSTNTIHPVPSRWGEHF